MTYDERLAVRVRALLNGQPTLVEKKMFGGLAYLANGEMFAGILKTIWSCASARRPMIRR